MSEHQEYPKVIQVGTLKVIVTSETDEAAWRAAERTDVPTPVVEEPVVVPEPDVTTKKVAKKK